MRIATIGLLSSALPLLAPALVWAEPAARTTEIIVTSEAGDRLALKDNVPLVDGVAEGNVIRVYPDRLRQTIDGIGSSFTESSAYVLAHLEPSQRREVMQKLFGPEGANFTLSRTHIGSCDFSVEGRYSYAEVAGDAALDGSFSIEPDQQGFDPQKHPGVRDRGYDLLPMIQEAIAIKASAGEPDLRIIASAWTAPPWMKDIEDWFIPGSDENNWQGTGGSLKPEHQATYARYLVKYLEAYADEGVSMWGITPVNEPHGNNGQWESMHFSPQSQGSFIKQHLGPALKSSRHADTRLLIYDQNRDGLDEWADEILSDAETAAYVYGIAVHWYASTFKVFEETLTRVHDKHPRFPILHTEGCIDDLGKEAPNGIQDPVAFKESNWFENDSFWWNPNATDWAYTATWAGQGVADHPIYTPVHRYARNIIVSLDHWMTGWVDWNCVLDSRGGPNHVGNFCGAPVMIDRDNGSVYYTPVYYALAQFSRTIRPGDRGVETSKQLEGLDQDALHACATLNPDGLLSIQLLNTTKQPITASLQIEDRFTELVVPANAIQTVRVQR